MKYPGYETMGELDLVREGLWRGSLKMILVDNRGDEYELEIFQFSLGGDSQAKINFKRRVFAAALPSNPEEVTVKAADDHYMDLTLTNLLMLPVTSGAPVMRFGKVG